LSYILDAVRKAEEERQQSQSPGVRNLGTVGISSDKRSNRKYWVSGALVLIFSNIAVWYALSENASSDQLAGKLVQGKGVPIEVADVKLPLSPEAADTRTPTEEIHPVHEVVDATSQPLQPVKLWQAPVDAQTAINGLEFSFHVYSTDSQRRTIIINKQRMREGERISDSMTLNRITVSGVVLAYENLLVEVEVLEQW